MMAGFACSSAACSSSDSDEAALDTSDAAVAANDMTTGGNSSTSDASLGDPIETMDGAWEYISFDDTKCRDGSPAGVSINRNNSSKKLMIYLEGGGACFETLSCLTNAASVGAATTPTEAGIFARANADNPVKDWNYVYVPYCTGDVHSGTKEDVTVPGVAGTQNFMGRRNLESFMKRIVPSFPDVEQVLFTGSSAGGFGAATNGEYVQKVFGDVPVFVIDDSGPSMSNEYMRGCLLEVWNEIWGFDDGFLADCGGDCTDPTNYGIEYSLHTIKGLRNDVMGGLYETTADGTISLFYGLGTDACPAASIPADQFKAGLLDFRATIEPLTSSYGTYFLEGTGHTILRSDAFYTAEVGGVKFVDWFSDIITGTKAAHVGP